MRSGTLAADLGVRVSNALDGDGVRQDSTQVDDPSAPAGPAPVQGQGQAVQGRVHTSAAAELRDMPRRKLDSLLVHARGPGGVVELGLSSRLDGSTSISVVSLDGLPFSPVVHTVGGDFHGAWCPFQLAYRARRCHHEVATNSIDLGTQLRLFWACSCHYDVACDSIDLGLLLLLIGPRSCHRFHWSYGVPPTSLFWACSSYRLHCPGHAAAIAPGMQLPSRS